VRQQEEGLSERLVGFEMSSEVLREMVTMYSLTEKQRPGLRRDPAPFLKKNIGLGICANPVCDRGPDIQLMSAGALSVRNRSDSVL